MTTIDSKFIQTQLYTGGKNLCPVVFIDEEFRPYPKYPRYLVSNYGRLYDTKNKCMKVPAKRGYLVYDITTAPCHRTSIGAHRMVLQTFCPIEDETGMVPNHKDLNKLNNKLENLEWVTQKENVHHAIKNGAFNPQGESNPTAKHSNFEIECICKLLEEGKSYKEICNKMNYNYPESIGFLSDVKNHHTWNHISTKYNF